MITKYTALKETRVNLREAIPLPKPFTLLIEPSSLCNFSCKMCFQSAEHQGKFKEKRGLMPMDIFEKAIDEAKAWAKLKVLKLCVYGEPLTNPNFCRMLSMACAAGIAERVETTTNASLLTAEVAEAMIAAGLDYVRVSIYGHDEASHAATARTKTPLQKIHNNLKLLQDMKRAAKVERPFVAVKMLDTFDPQRNAAFKAAFADVADELYLDQPHNWVQPAEESFIDKIVPESFAENRTGQYACPMPFTTLAVRSNGDVAPCCIDWYGSTIIGNIRQQSLQELWNSPAHKKLMYLQLSDNKKMNPSCGRCNLPQNPHYTRDNLDGVDPGIVGTFE